MNIQHNHQRELKIKFFSCTKKIVSLLDTTEQKLFRCGIQQNRICSIVEDNITESVPLQDTPEQIDTTEHDIFKLKSAHNSF
jgi:hypothetical protein